MKRAAILLALLGGACASSHVPPPTLADAGGDSAALVALSRGRELYVDKCSGCHRLYSVDEYADADWEKHVDEMLKLKKARLAADERIDLLKYLQALNEVPRDRR